MDEVKKEYPAAKARITGNKKAFLSTLIKNGLIEVACQKVGVSRQTYYRWRKEDRVFREEADAAIRHGSETTDDLVESKFMKLIHDGDRGSILFYLKYRHAKYSDRAAIRRMVAEHAQDDVTELTKEDEERIDKAVKSLKTHLQQHEAELYSTENEQSGT